MDPEDPDDPDHSQNLITSSFYHFGHIVKCSQLSKQTDRQPDGQTNPGENMTSLAEVTILLQNTCIASVHDTLAHECNRTVK